MYFRYRETWIIRECSLIDYWGGPPQYYYCLHFAHDQWGLSLGKSIEKETNCQFLLIIVNSRCNNNGTGQPKVPLNTSRESKSKKLYIYICKLRNHIWIKTFVLFPFYSVNESNHQSLKHAQCDRCKCCRLWNMIHQIGGASILYYREWLSTLYWFSFGRDTVSLLITSFLMR